MKNSEAAAHIVPADICYKSSTTCSVLLLPVQPKSGLKSWKKDQDFLVLLFTAFFGSCCNYIWSKMYGLWNLLAVVLTRYP